MDRELVLERMRREKIIAIVRGVETASIGEVALALAAGGITCMEITVDHRTKDGPEETYRSIAWLRERMGEAVCLGAGTVLDEEETRRAVAAGADYIISPSLDQGVIRLTRDLGKVSIPGTFTPSEAVQAYRWGADIVKLFPAGLLGVGYIKALKGPPSPYSVLRGGRDHPGERGGFHPGRVRFPGNRRESGGSHGGPRKAVWGSNGGGAAVCSGRGRFVDWSYPLR